MHADSGRLGRAPHPGARLAVIVCTRERPEDLARCLEALRLQSEQPLDVLVVDNNPRTDRTRMTAHAAGVRYVVEPRPGLDCARNAGIAATSAPLVAFTDDDAVPEPGWAEAHVRALGEPGIGGVAGPMLAMEVDTPAQRLFEQYLDLMARKRPRDQRRVYAPPFPAAASGQVGAGANMAFRRSALAAVGPFDPAFDAGTPTESGGDTEMFGQLLDAGFTLVHEPAARVRHRHRRTRAELRRQLFGYGVGVYAYWTHRWLRRRDRDVPGFAAQTLGWHIGHRLWRAVLRRDGELPPDLVLAEIIGSLYGPIAYFRARRRANRWRSAGELSSGAPRDVDSR